MCLSLGSHILTLHPQTANLLVIVWGPWVSILCFDRFPATVPLLPGGFQSFVRISWPLFSERFLYPGTVTHGSSQEYCLHLLVWTLRITTFQTWRQVYVVEISMVFVMFYFPGGCPPPDPRGVPGGRPPGNKKYTCVFKRAAPRPPTPTAPMGL